MNPKITLDHLGRGAVVYVRQSTMGQVAENTESQRRQYALAESARTVGFASVVIIDDDLGRSGSGTIERPGFQKLVASVCTRSVGAVFCIEASRLARNGRDWHHLIDLCALVGTLVVDPDGTYDPRLVNDRLLLGLKGTMSEYELSLLRQRGLAARDSKALRGELRFALPPGYCWNEIGQIEMEPDERVAEAIRMVLDKFRELGSARQVMLWAQDAGIKLPVTRRSAIGCKIEWRRAAYHSVLQVLRHPMYAGAYVFGRTTNRTTGGGPRQEDYRTQQADERLEYFAPGSSPRLHKLGRLRSEPAADIGELPHAEAYRQKVGAWRTCAADRSRSLCTMRPRHAGLLWHKLRPSLPLSLPWR